MAARGVVIGMALLALYACGENRQPVAPTPIVEALTPVASPAPPSPPARVQGIVLDFQSATPLPGAVVGFGTGSGVGGVPIGIPETAVSDASGRYSLPEPPWRSNTQPYILFVNNQPWGSVHPRATNYRADVAVDKGLCIARYGMVLDSKTHLPITDATARDLSNRVIATSGRDGWYHIDFGGCGVGYSGFNTRWSIMSHPDYNSTNFAGGRGISGVYREDVVLTPR